MEKHTKIGSLGGAVSNKGIVSKRELTNIDKVLSFVYQLDI